MAINSRDADFYKVTLKSWLYERIKLNQQRANSIYPGLEWLDEERRYFKLPWVTESHPEWAQYYKLFHEWASREGKVSTDSQKAKRNFRSALNHSKHFKHIEFMDQERQTESYKVYQFLTQEEIARAKPRNVSEDSSVSQLTPDSQYRVTTPNNGFIELGPNGDQAMMQAVPHHGQLVNNLNLDQGHQWNQPMFQMPMNIPGQEEAAGGDVEMLTSDILSVGSEKCNSILLANLKDDKAKCTITIEYNGRRVQFAEVSLDNTEACLIIYGDSSHVERVNTLNLGRLFPIFPKSVISLKRPESETPGLNKILQHMNTGIFLWFDEPTMSFYMMRECLAHVYCFNMHDELNNGEVPQKPLQIARKKSYRMFSYNHYMDKEMENVALPDQEKDHVSDTVEIIVGIQPRPEDAGRTVKGVKISVQFPGACNLSNREQISSMKEIMLSSNLSSLDRQLPLAQNTSRQPQLLDMDQE